MSNPAARTWLQYTHLDTLYSYLMRGRGLTLSQLGTYSAMSLDK